MTLNYSCPLCESDNWKLLHEVKGHFGSFNGKPCKFYICLNCGITCRYPRPDPDKTIDSFYALEYWEKTDVSDLSLFNPGSSARLNVIKDVINESWEDETIVDMGCGFGSFCATLSSSLPNSKIVGVEPSVGLANQLQQCNTSANIEIVNGSLERFDIRAKAIFLVTVFEHVLDPLLVLEKLHSQLVDGGWLIIEVPDVMEPGSLGLDYFFRDFHLFYYSNETLSALLKKAGFEVIAVKQGGAFKTATAPTLCIVARKAEKKAVEVNDSERIIRRLQGVKMRTQILGPLTYFYRYKLKRPIRAKARRIYQRVQGFL